MARMDSIKPSSLIYGADCISHCLRCCLVPYGWAYKFDSRAGHNNRPVPLSCTVPLMCASPLVSLVLLVYLIGWLSVSYFEPTEGYLAIISSVFIVRTYSILNVIRVILITSCLLITMSQHGCISNVIATRNNYLNDKEQFKCAIVTLVIFLLNVVSLAGAYSTVFLSFSNGFSNNKGTLFYIVLATILGLLSWTRLTICAPLIYFCYLSAALGRHVENFSALYVDTMFDQFMKAIEKEGEENKHFNQMLPFPFLNDSADSDDNNDTATANGIGGGDGEKSESKKKKKKHYKKTFQDGFPLFSIGRLMIGIVSFIYNLLRSIVARLSMRKYPELPEMKMIKLSSTTKIIMSERMQTANKHLIRIRLRRTQVMLSDLRDQINDINTTSSPLVLLYLAYEAMFTILITTASVQAKVYKSISILILPSLSVIISLVSIVMYVCVCFDEPTKQLRLLINKLFDFIIMNHRVQSSGRRMDHLRAGVDYEPGEVSLLPGSEPGAINETWSQFQYIRKLANTIQLTMGGFVPVTRRLVLSILGHILSAAFISIEIMSIIDTMNAPPRTSASSSPLGRHNLIGRHHHHSNRRDY